MNVVVGLAVLSVVVHSAACVQVYVRFLTPPHGYTHNLQLNPREGVAVSKEERLYPNPHESRTKKLQTQARFQPQPAVSYRGPQQPNYYYLRPAKPFDEYGAPPQFPQQYQGEQEFPPPPGQGPRHGPPPEPFLPSGEYVNPALMGLSQHQSEVTYDPLLITGPQAVQYVNYLFSRGELFFHLIPHERLVLMNQRDRVENNLLPHALASIRPGHPFFIHR